MQTWLQLVIAAVSGGVLTKALELLIQRDGILHGTNRQLWVRITALDARIATLELTIERKEQENETLEQENQRLSERCEQLENRVEELEKQLGMKPPSVQT